MSVTGILYLVNKATKHINYAGEVPKTYGNITGLSDVDYSELRDLETHFGAEYKNLGFLTREEALGLGVSTEKLDEMTAAAWELKWNELRPEREDKILAIRWRVERHQDEVALNQPLTEDIKPVLQYIQALRDLPETQPNPYVMVWPEVPA